MNEESAKLGAFIEANLESLTKAYLEHVFELEDAMSHKVFMLKSERCFEDWCAEQMEKEESKS